MHLHCGNICNQSHQMLAGKLDVGLSNIMMILRQSIAP